MQAPAPVFYYDFNSPYSYLAAHRLDEVLPVEPRWQPIAFGFLIRAVGKTPWSLGEGREAGIRECESRAAARGLPLRWPAGWPVGNYSIPVLRAALVAGEGDALRRFSLAAFAANFAQARDLSEVETVLDVAETAGLDRDLIRDGIERPEIRDRLRHETDAAVTRGITGVPTVAVGEELFWGDDRLEDAAAALRA